jgi:phenylalanyl-tRNA synthetase beta chain
VAIAGIMGGLHSEITPDTSQVLIESAFFDPTGIRRSSKKLGLRTESSYRFERGVDPEGVIRALNRAAQLMQQVGGGEIAADRADAYPRRISPVTLTLDVDRTNRFLGTALDTGQIAAVLRAIELEVSEVDDNRLNVVVPTFRPDLTREVDLAEEVARLVGYDHIPVTVPEAGIEAASAAPHFRAREDLKPVLQCAGFFEVLTYSFISVDSLGKLELSEGDPRLSPIPLRNPLSEDQAVMRTSLVPGLLDTARYNIDRGNEDLRIYELSKVFLPAAAQALPEERYNLCGLLGGRRDPQPLHGQRDDVDYSDVKGMVEEICAVLVLPEIRYTNANLPPYMDPGCAAAITCGDRVLGCLGRIKTSVQEAFDLKKPVFLFELDFDLAFSVREPRPLFRSLPKFPAVVRDMAIVVDEGVTVQEPLDFILQQRQALLEEVEVFDIYKSPQLGPNKVSLGYRLVYRATDRSLTDEEVNVLHSRMVEDVLDTFRATLR